MNRPLPLCTTTSPTGPDTPPEYGPGVRGLLAGGYVPRVRAVERLLDLVAIFEPDVQVCYWPRTLPPGCVTDDASLAAWTGRQVIARSALATRHTAGPLAADILHVLGVFADLLDCPTLGVRLEALDRAMCPSFHIDNTSLRLTCAYRGPGTDWHGRLDGDAGESGIGGTPTGALVLVKGSNWPGNGARGGVHRSPPQAVGQPRLLLTVDALWD